MSLQFYKRGDRILTLITMSGNVLKEKSKMAMVVYSEENINQFFALLTDSQQKKFWRAVCRYDHNVRERQSRKKIKEDFIEVSSEDASSCSCGDESRTLTGLVVEAFNNAFSFFKQT